MFLRKVKKIFFYTIAVILLVLATLVSLIETKIGSRLTVEYVAKKYNIELGGVSGNLRKGLDIGWIKYNNNKQSVIANGLSFRWNASALLYSAISIDSLSIQSLKIEVAKSELKSTVPFSKWPSLKLPVRIELKKFRFTNIEYSQGDYHDQWQRLSGSISLGTFHLRYTPLVLVHDRYKLRLEGKSDLDYPYDTSAKLIWQIEADTLYKGRSEIIGSLKQLKTPTRLIKPAKAKSNIDFALVNKQHEFITEPKFSVDLIAPKQALPSSWWITENTIPEVNLHLIAEGNWKGYSGNLTGQFVHPDWPGVDVNLQAKGNLQNISIADLQITETQIRPEKTSAILHVQGDVHWLPKLTWNLKSFGDNLDLSLFAEDWPTQLRAEFSVSGEKVEQDWNWKVDQLNVQGSVRDLAFSLSGGISQARSQLASEKLQLIWGANRLDINGVLAKKSNLEWSLRAPLMNQIDNHFAGSLTSKGFLSGSWSLPKINMETIAENFVWKEYAVEKLQLNFLSDGAINSAQNTNALTSSMNEKPSTGELADFGNQYYRLTVLANNLRIQENLFKLFQLSGEGSWLKHQLSGIVRHNKLGKLDFNLTGEFKDKKWQGKLAALSIKFKKLPKWWLSSSRFIQIEEKQVQIQPLCFTTRSNQTAVIDQSTQVDENSLANTPFHLNASALDRPYQWLASPNPNPRSNISILPPPELCLNMFWKKDFGIAVDMDIRDVPLRQFYALFKPEVFFAGVMDGYFHFYSSNFTLASSRASLLLETRNAELRYQYEGSMTEVYPWNYASISAQLENSQLRNDFSMDWTSFGKIAASSELALDTKSITQGNVHAVFDNLEPLETLLPFMDDVKGKLSADVRLGGNFEKPQVAGKVTLNEASARIPKLGLNLNNMGIEISADNSDRVNLKASVGTGKGELYLEGSYLYPLQNNWQVQANLHGNNFQIVNLLTLKANITPNFTLQADSQLIKLSGEAEVPYLRADIKTLPQSTVRVSDDVMLIDEKIEVAKKSNAIPIQANFRLKLGDDVKFTGFGLDSALSGDVRLIKEPQHPWMTNGFVAVKEGSYKAYGQTLSIDRGRLIFQGDYENPGLDINAYRLINDENNTKVVLEISGTLQKPQAKVKAYSSTAVSDSDAMMMLLTGKPLADASKADASMLLAALGGLGVERSQGITQDVAQLFGVDELSIKSKKGIDQSQLWVGKYLTPRLLVRYVVGLFDQAFSFGVVYRLTDRVRVEAESGETQSLDVIYKIER